MKDYQDKFTKKFIEFENCDNLLLIPCLLNIPARIEPMSKETDTLSLIILKKNSHETKVIIYMFVHSQPKSEKNLQ